MAIFQWQENMSVGNLTIDTQHKQLVNIINKLGDAMQQGKAADVINDIVRELVGYTVRHFRDEELLFAATDYPHTALHKEKHQILVGKVKQLEADLAAGRTSVSVAVLNFLLHDALPI